MPRLIDPVRRDLVRARATDRGMFLQEEAAFEIEDRLQAVNKSFKSVAVVTPFPQVWRGRFPGATVVADTDTLALVPGAHDLVIHALGLHWADDPLGQLIQCHRALRPDGFFIGALFGGETLHELRNVLTRVEVAHTGGLSPRLLPMAEIRDLGALLQRAGYALPVADALRKHVSYADVFALFHDLRAMGEGNALASRAGPTPRAFFHAVAREYAETHGADGRIQATFDLIFLAGWAPHESQQKPLRPGTAEMRLDQVLSGGADVGETAAEPAKTDRGETKDDANS